MPMGIGLRVSLCNVMGGASFSPLDLGAPCVEWWDWRTGGTGAAITTHPGAKGVATLSQSTAGYKPVWNAAGYAVFDATDDYLQFTLATGVAAGQMWIETTRGWYKSGIGNWAAGTHRFASADVRQAIFIDTATITGPQITSLTAYMSGTQYHSILKSTNVTSVRNRVDNTTDTNYSVTYYDNSNSYARNSSQSGETINLTALGGITSPVTTVVPIAVSSDAALTIYQIYQNLSIGCLYSISSNATLSQHYVQNNKLCGVINAPVASATQALFDNNWFTGNIQNLSGNANLSFMRVNDNYITGYDGGSVSALLLHFQAQNNLLTASAVNAILAAFVAAGGASGALNLGGNW